MSEAEHSEAPARIAELLAHADYTGGVYGSLLAASVVVGAGATGVFSRIDLVLLLVSTGVVFWIAHVHAQLFGARLVEQVLSRRVVLHVCREEWPIVKAAVPPAAAVAVSPLLGLDLRGGGLAGARRRRGRAGGLVGGRGTHRGCLLAPRDRERHDQSPARAADHHVQDRPEGLTPGPAVPTVHLRQVRPGGSPARRIADEAQSARPSPPEGEQLMRYEIRVDGQLSETLSKAFPEMDHLVLSGQSVLVGPVVDEAHLYGLLARCQSLGLRVVEMHRLPE
ncbi:hypothetical protein GCM10022206_43100 [Streptomyces chiangmaiensis]